MYPYGLIGNCQVSALIRNTGALEWLCLPRPDSPPVFGGLLDPDGGRFTIELVGMTETSQRYVPNTNVLVTELKDASGGIVEITDFCPRFLQHGRMYRPAAVFRKVERKAGTPSIRVSCRPVDGWDRAAVAPARGSSHLRWDIRGDHLRLLTDMPLTYLLEESPFVLQGSHDFALTWGVGIEDDLHRVSQRFLEETLDYWRTWVKHCSVPTLFQKETIRSALALKLHCFEDTGAILAALTTSLPEEAGSERNWDYRFCWLRDAYYVLSAFRNLGHFEEMEGFLRFVLGIAYHHEHSRDRLRPVYALDGSLPLPERIHPAWRGFGASRPVRSMNQAAEHIQNDVYGELILALVPIFQDERFFHLRTPEHEELIAHLARFCARKISEPDAGLWEIRNNWQEHTFSNLMCWAGLDRVKSIQGMGYALDASFDIAGELRRAHDAVRAAVKEGSVRNGPGDPTFDAALLHLPILRFPDRALCENTVARIEAELQVGAPSGPGYLFRYKRPDDFGSPRSAFLICSFWLVQALAATGRMDEARDVMERVTASANPLGLLSEHFLPDASLQAGNFPQAYSHVGLINAAFAVSPSWDQVL